MKITMMPTADLHPNDWNPNRRTEDEFTELVAEIKRTGHLPKPILVRGDAADRGGFEIVDGEHAWKAANQLDMAEVPVEVEDMDDLEAMLQTLKRNQHGTHNRVLEGQMFERMRTAGRLSLRAMEKAVGKSQGYVRDSLAYAKLARLRSRSAPETAQAEVVKMGVREVREFLQMPPVLAAECMRHNNETPIYEPDEDDPVTWKYVDKIGLMKCVTGSNDHLEVLGTIMWYAEAVHRLDVPAVAPLAALLLEWGDGVMCPLHWFLVKGVIVVTPAVLAAAIQEVDEEPRQNRIRRRNALYAIGQRDGWIAPDDEQEGPPTRRKKVAVRKKKTVRRRDPLANAPKFITKMDWPVEQQQDLYACMNTWLYEGGDPGAVEAATKAAIAKGHDVQGMTPESWLSSDLLDFKKDKLLGDRDAMLDELAQEFEDYHGQLGPYRQALRGLLAELPLGALALFGRHLHIWDEEAADSILVDELEKRGSADTSVEPPPNAKLARLRELEAKIGGANA